MNSFDNILASIGLSPDGLGAFWSSHVPANPRNIKSQSQKHKRKKARQVRASGRSRRG